MFFISLIHLLQATLKGQVLTVFAQEKNNMNINIGKEIESLLQGALLKGGYFSHFEHHCSTPHRFEARLCRPS